jgi:ubiquinone/menaquinone biosynthesis C-methylase UbiE
MNGSMDARLQRRVQRYGWDLAADAYARHWHGPLAGVQREFLTLAAPLPGEVVLDVACGTGVVAVAAARAVGPGGRVLGVDLADAMVHASRQRAQHLTLGQVAFERMDAEQLQLPDAHFDLALCALGLMYVPDPDTALRELHRVLRPEAGFIFAVPHPMSAVFDGNDATARRRYGDTTPTIGELAMALQRANFSIDVMHELKPTHQPNAVAPSTLVVRARKLGS